MSSGATMDVHATGFVNNMATSNGGAAVYLDKASSMQATDCDFLHNSLMHGKKGTTLFASGSLIKLVDCCFNSSQGSTSIVHVTVGKLQLHGQIHFFSSASKTMAIKLESALVSSFQLMNARVIFHRSMGVSIAGESHITNSSWQFSEADDPVSVFNIEKGSNIEWKGTLFDGNGNLSITAGVTVDEVSACTFGKNVRLSFVDIAQTAVRRWRGNSWQHQTIDLRFAGVYMCDEAGNGHAAGCDRMALCRNQTLGGVQCSCVSLVSMFRFCPVSLVRFVDPHPCEKVHVRLLVRLYVGLSAHLSARPPNRAFICASVSLQ